MQDFLHTQRSVIQGDQMRNYPIGDFAKIAGVTTQTLRNWHKRGSFIPAYVSEGGTRYYSEQQVRLIQGKANPDRDRTIIGYCRVSSNKQKVDLQRQVETMRMYLAASGTPFEIVEDIGSGINYSKKGLRQLILRICNGEVAKVVVLYKDRLLRFGFELVEYVAELHGTEIEIIDNTEKTQEQELVEDLVQIITEFSCKLQGKRANKTKRMVKELIADD